MKTILFTYLFFWASSGFLSQKTTNFVFCVYDSSDYDFQKLTEQLNNKYLITAKDYVFCYINDDKLNHIYINPNNKDTLSRLNSSYTNTSTYNKDLLFEFMLIFENHLNAEDTSKINLFLLLHTNNLAKYLPLKTTVKKGSLVLNELWNNICHLSAIDQERLNRFFMICDDKKYICSREDSAYLENYFSSIFLK